MEKIKFTTLNELYEDMDFEVLLNVDLVKQLCDLQKIEFVKFFELIYKEIGFQTYEGFYVDKDTVGLVIDKIKN